MFSKLHLVNWLIFVKLHVLGNILNVKRIKVNMYFFYICGGIPAVYVVVFIKRELIIHKACIIIGPNPHPFIVLVQKGTTNIL